MTIVRTRAREEYMQSIVKQGRVEKENVRNKGAMKV